MAEEKHTNRVREIRMQHGITQGTLAERVGVSRQSINYIEQGTFAPSVYLALKIADVLETTVEVLFGGTKEC
jgi:putative transcriptional regulator